MKSISIRMLCVFVLLASLSVWADDDDGPPKPVPTVPPPKPEEKPPVAPPDEPVSKPVPPPEEVPPPKPADPAPPEKDVLVGAANEPPVITSPLSYTKVSSYWDEWWNCGDAISTSMSSPGGLSANSRCWAYDWNYSYGYCGYGDDSTTVRFSVGYFEPDGDKVTVTYDYGDGTTGTDPQHYYASYGTFRATVYVSDGIESVASSCEVSLNLCALPTIIVCKYLPPPRIANLEGTIKTRPDGAGHCQISGSIDVDKSKLAAGQKFSMDAGGTRVEFTLDAKGHAKCHGGKIKTWFKADKKTKAVKETTTEKIQNCAWSDMHSVFDLKHPAQTSALCFEVRLKTNESQRFSKHAKITIHYNSQVFQSNCDLDQIKPGAYKIRTGY